MTLNLEWEHNGGSGPHCLVVGKSDQDTQAMLQYVGSRLTASRTRSDLELINSCGEPPEIDNRQYYWDADQLGDHVDQHLHNRHQLLRSLKCHDVEAAREAGHSIPTTVILIAATTPKPVDSGRLERWARAGRSAGISMIAGVTSLSVTESPQDNALGLLCAIERSSADHVGLAAAANLSTSAIVHLGDNRGRLIVAGPTTRAGRRVGTSTVFTMN